MIQREIIKWLLAIGLVQMISACSANSVLAQTYIGIGSGSTYAHVANMVPAQHTNEKVFIGYRTNCVAFEFGYINFGTFTATVTPTASEPPATARDRQEAFAISVLGYLGSELVYNWITRKFFCALNTKTM
jgi:hypothetical protein